MINKLKKKRNTLDETPCIITVRGEPASKANSRRLVMMGGKPRFIKSKKALGYSSGFNTQVGCRKELIEDKVYKNDRQVKLKHIEWGLDKENPRAIIVVGPRDQKELVVDTLHQALKEES